ncbi:ROK family transcriptional regulator [Agromyces ramosus]|uniref:NBD/HSP70 family sugar kinase n=1 Tax=Agromyces ramosus TaxID=33879 RepID=A0ABU0R8E8_9MICO|nr:ROK family transcriptional regulator [Agromyces ramosus]MDQ0894346.1 putative NBD/HSP70 family sugar kinase [Agromyces ramosus]
MTEVGETSVPTTTGPLGEVHREQSARVLEHLVTHGPATRSELATATGLGRGAIAGLTARLLDAGVLRATTADASGDGRTAPLTLAAADHVLVTALLGADDAIATISTLGGEEFARFTAPLSAVAELHEGGESHLPTPIELLAVVLGRALARADRSGHPIADVSVLVEGSVAGRPPVAVADGRLGVEPIDVIGELRARTPALDEVEAALPLPISLTPLAVAAAMAEHAALSGVGDLLYLSGDTSVMGAVISSGRPMLGAHGLAAMFAHLPVVPDGVRCECGQRGCLATVAAPALVLERAGLGDFAAAHGQQTALAELVARIEAADDRARWSWLDAALWIGRTLQIVVPALDPAVIVVGGYWASLIGDIESAFRSNRPTLGSGALATIPAVAAARAGTDSALAGARRQARERLVSEPFLLAG